MDEFSQKLYEVMKAELPVCRVNNDRTQIMVRCPYCGDSIKSKSSAHFYIQTYSPYFGYCQRCNTSSIVDISMLKDFNISSRQLHVEVAVMMQTRKNNNFVTKTVGSTDYIKSLIKSKDIEIPNPTGSDNELEKLEYLNNRLGLNLRLVDCINLSIILNFKEFSTYNNLTFKSNQVEKIKMFHKHCIGFLSQDRNFITFRSLDPAVTNFRYYIYNIEGDSRTPNKRKYYTIPQYIDLSSNEIKIVITEGAFDLLSVYYNIYNGNVGKNNIVFISTNGIGMHHVINTVCRLGFLSPEIEIYADQGVELSYFKYMKRNNDFLQESNQIKIIYNTLDKDVGVPKERIKLTETYV